MAATFESFKPRWPLTFEFQRGGGTLPVSRPFTWSLRLVCCAALGVTAYLAITALREGEVAGCSGGAVWDCNVALHSRWSKVLAMPVSFPAFGLYAVILASLLVCRPSAPRQRVRIAWGIVSAGALAAGLAAIWFISLQVFVLRHLCVYCLAAHSCGLVLALAVSWKRPLGTQTTAKLAGLAALGVAGLITAQLVAAPPPTYKVETYSNAGTTPNAATTPNTTSTPNTVTANYPPRPATRNGQPANGANAKPQAKSSGPILFEPPSGVPDDSDK